MAALPAGTVPRFAAFGVLAGGLGALSGVIWWWVVDLPVYTVAADGGASTTERGLAEYFAGDAWFCLLGLLVGAGLGIAAWRLFRGVGWIVVPLVLLATSVAALLCWLVGYQLGPGDFTARLAAAQPGELVPVALTVRAKASLLVWPFVAVLPLLIGSSLGRDEEEPRPIFRRTREGRFAAVPSVRSRLKGGAREEVGRTRRKGGGTRGLSSPGGAGR